MDINIAIKVVKILKKINKHKFLVCFYFLLFCLFLFISSVLPLSFDDAVFIDTAKNLSQHGLYSYQFLFNPIVTTGFPVIIPTSILYIAFPFDIIGARIIAVLYFLFFITSVYLITHQHGFGKQNSIKVTILTITLCLFTIPNFIITSLRLYGEIPALAFLLLSLIFFLSFLKKKQLYALLLCGLFAGLSFSTKYIMIFAFPSILIAFISSHINANKKQLAANLFILVFGMIIPESIFRLYHLMTVGPARFLEDIKNLFLYYQNLNLLTHLESTSGNILYDHLFSLKVFGISPLAPIAFFIFAGISFIYSIRSKKYALQAMIIFGILIYLRWLFLTQNTLIRHLLPSLVVVNMLLSAFIIAISEKIDQKRSKILVIALICLVGIAVIQSSAKVFLDYNIKIHVYKKMSQEQNRIANFISTQENAVFYHLLGHSVPEYALLTGKKFKPYQPKAKLNIQKNNFLVLTPKALKKTDCNDNKIVFSSYSFFICKL